LVLLADNPRDRITATSGKAVAFPPVDLDHVNIKVADVQVAAEFLRDALGGSEIVDPRRVVGYYGDVDDTFDAWPAEAHKYLPPSFARDS
jgi:hypothetical protein